MGGKLGWDWLISPYIAIFQTTQPRGGVLREGQVPPWRTPTPQVVEAVPQRRTWAQEADIFHLPAEVFFLEEKIPIYEGPSWAKWFFEQTAWLFGHPKLCFGIKAGSKSTRVSFCILSAWNVFDTYSPTNWHVFWKIAFGKWHFLLGYMGWSLFREHVNFRGGNKVDFESYV